MKDWEKLYIEIIEKLKEIQNKQKENIKDYSEDIDYVINKLKEHKSELIKQLKNQDIEVTEENTFSELISKIGDIEGGGETPDYDFLANIEILHEEEMKIGDYIFKTRNGRDMKGEFPIFRNLKEIERFAFSGSNFIGEFPLLPKLEHIGMWAFGNSNFTGEFPLLPNVKEIKGLAFGDSNFTGEFPLLSNIEIIDNAAFENSNFTGEFPYMETLKEIGYNAFENSNFTGEFPLLSEIKEIGDVAFRNSNFTGEFPLLPNIEIIDNVAFRNSNFTGEFPYMETLKKIGYDAFLRSKFDKDEDGFVKNYPGWDGRSSWSKPASYRAEMADEIPPKLMTIFAPGGEMEVHDDVQGERARKYLEENEPSDIDYYLEYTEKLREIGFERDEFGNYVDVVNDRSVIIIPEDIKFMV